MMRSLILLASLAVAGCRDEASGGVPRTHIRVVGSSTVYPFTTVVAERFVAALPDARAPVIESTGTGAGIRLFCAGVGPAYPDIVDASRRMRATEYRDCARHGAGAILEVQVGSDGLVVGQATTAPGLALSTRAIYRAIAATPGGRTNTARSWADADPSLPATPITLYGPPATSGTRDAFATLILARGCAEDDPRAAALAIRDPDRHRARCTRVREDGAYADAGENDNLIVQKLRANPQALGIFGYSYLAENAGTVRGVAIDGVPPTYAAIAAGRYPGARPLYLYVKAAHLGTVPHLRDFLRLYAAAWGPDGPLVRRGLIAAPAEVRAAAAATIGRAVTLDPDTLT